jgi:hypothetical protein
MEGGKILALALSVTTDGVASGRKISVSAVGGEGEWIYKTAVSTFDHLSYASKQEFCIETTSASFSNVSRIDGLVRVVNRLEVHDWIVLPEMTLAISLSGASSGDILRVGKMVLGYGEVVEF